MDFEGERSQFRARLGTTRRAALQRLSAARSVSPSWRSIDRRLLNGHRSPDKLARVPQSFVPG